MANTLLLLKYGLSLLVVALFVITFSLILNEADVEDIVGYDFNVKDLVAASIASGIVLVWLFPPVIHVWGILSLMGMIACLLTYVFKAFYNPLSIEPIDPRIVGGVGIGFTILTFLFILFDRDRSSIFRFLRRKKDSFYDSGALQYANQYNNVPGGYTLGGGGYTY